MQIWNRERNGNLKTREMSNERTEKIGLLLAELTNDPRLRDKKVCKRESDKLRTKNNNSRILVNLIKLDLQINSFIVLLEAPTDLAFFAMAWLAVYQIKELESTTHEVFWRTRAKTVEFERPSQYRPVKDCRSSESAVYASGREVGIARSGGEGALAT